MRPTLSQLEQALKASSNDAIPSQVWHICPNQFEYEPAYLDAMVDRDIYSECEARNEAQRLAKMVGHRVVVDTKLPGRNWYGYEKDFTVYPWETV